MTDSTLAIEHEKIQVVLTIENGKVTSARDLRDNELIATMDTFFWMAKKAGFQVIAPNAEKQ
ncbi:hypothetical protein [Klebsiella oxytoca]|uniref:hypothetical protein n=1 Tax=Klebsiella oxytoca TaxID=571 RepID=UPI002245C248|nr:hypothetical protein [Klebsiella oxytoca]MCW9549660.1 hypothetical protein [Klebsiella oxytoca]